MGSKKGYQSHEPTDALRTAIREAKENGDSLRQTARDFHLDIRTIKKHYRVELGIGAAARQAIGDEEQRELAVECFEAIRDVVNGDDSAKDGRAAVLIFTAKALLGWKETVLTEHVKRDRDDWTNEELDQLIAAERARVEKAAA